MRAVAQRDAADGRRPKRALASGRARIFKSRRPQLISVLDGPACEARSPSVFLQMKRADSYIHGTEPAEQRRLAALNRMTNHAFVRFLNVGTGARVLEVGSGLGILAAAVASAAEGVRVVGVEKSPEQIAAAVKSPSVAYVEGDAQRLDFPDGSFDLVYARFLLEHVPDPEQVLR